MIILNFLPVAAFFAILALCLYRPFAQRLR